MPLDPDVCPSCLRRVTAELELESERRGHARTREMLARAIERAAEAERASETAREDAASTRDDLIEALEALTAIGRVVEAPDDMQAGDVVAGVERLAAEVERLRAPTEPDPAAGERMGDLCSCGERLEHVRDGWWRCVDCGVPAERVDACPAHAAHPTPRSQFDTVSGPVPEEDDDGA